MTTCTSSCLDAGCKRSRTASIYIYGHMWSDAEQHTMRHTQWHQELVALCTSDIAEVQAAHSQDGRMQTLSSCMNSKVELMLMIKCMVIQGGCMQGCAHRSHSCILMQVWNVCLCIFSPSLLTCTCMPSSDTQLINPTLLLGWRASAAVPATSGGPACMRFPSKAGPLSSRIWSCAGYKC